VLQRPFGSGWHDSLQFHAFCEGRAFAVRVFWTRSLWHHSAWVYDGGVAELLNSDEPLSQSAAPYADLHGTDFALSAPDEAVSIRIGDDLSLTLTPRRTMYGPSPIGPGLHHPDMAAVVRHRGRRLEGLAYCKRYDFRGEPIRYWGYRFVHGTLDDHSRSLWTAQATFGFGNHSYFRFIDADGVVREALDRDSCHRDDHCYGVVDGEDYDVELEELGVWDTVLRSDAMDSRLRQRFCRMTVHSGKGSEQGYAINEFCSGTLA